MSASTLSSTTGLSLMCDDICLRAVPMSAAVIPWFYIAASISLSYLISPSISLSMASLGSSLILGFVFIDLARSAYLRVESVSSKFSSAGDNAAIITVFVFPPRESCNNRVSLESRKGICLETPSTRAFMTFPSADNDKLMFLASSRRSPVACVLLWRSDPARSTRLSLPTLNFYSPSA